MTIADQVDEIKEYFAHLNHSDFEIVLVYDCGIDRSWEIIKKIKYSDPDRITAVKLTRNFGQHNALICGFKHATGDLLVTMDEDLQHDSFEITKLIEEQMAGAYDVVYGTYKEARHSFFRKITSKFLKLILIIGIPDLSKDYSSFRLIRKEIAIKTIEMNNSYTFLDGYLAWITKNVGSIEVNHRERKKGRSSYSFIKLLNHTINIFVTFSILPIRLLSISSIVILCVSTFYALYLILRKIFYNDLIPGYTSIMVVLGIGIGIIVFGLGVIGEYIHRINLKTTRKPNYVEEEVL